MESMHPETAAISAGRPQSVPGAALNPAISLNSTFTAGGEIGYGRFGNETWSALEATIPELKIQFSKFVFRLKETTVY